MDIIGDDIADQRLLCPCLQCGRFFRNAASRIGFSLASLVGGVDYRIALE